MQIVSATVSRHKNSSARVNFTGDQGDSIAIDLRDGNISEMTDDDVVRRAREIMETASVKPEDESTDSAAHGDAGIDQTLDQP